MKKTKCKSRKTELRIGVIGVGGRGALANHAHKPQDGVRIVAGADVSEAALKKFKERYPDAFIANDYRRLLERDDVDAVFVTSPDFLHEEQSVAALQAGKAVYCEKPMAITIAGCDRMLRTAKETGSKLYIGHNMRHFAFVQRMREIIRSGKIGEPKAGWCRHFVSYGGDAYFKDWHAERSKSTGLLLQKGAHDIDVLHWLCGGYTKRVVGMGGLTLYHMIKDRHSPQERGDASFRIENWPPLSQKGLNPIIDVEDLSMVLMELDSGVYCSYQQCHYTPDAWRNYTIIGTQGRIENIGESCIRIWTRRCGYNPFGDEQYYVPEGVGGHGGSDPSIVAEFVRYVREGGKIKTSPIAARNAVATGCLATESIRSGNAPFDIPPVPADIRAYFDKDLEK